MALSVCRHPRALAMALLLGCAPVLAQSSAAPATTKPDTGTDSAGGLPNKATAAPNARETTIPAPAITVLAERPTNRIDRQVYDLAADLSTTSSTLADALNNVPSVAVDPDGTLTLRGSSSVQILIDGKPSAMLQGENRAAALAAIPADDIESVEVINNPGAQFGNDGGAAIINLVMRRQRRAGGYGVLNANLGSAGRFNSALSGSYNEGRLGFQGGLNVRHDLRHSSTVGQRERIDGQTGLVTRSKQSSTARDDNDAFGMNATLSYNHGSSDTLAANLAYAVRRNDQQSAGDFQTLGADAWPVSAYRRQYQRDGDGKNTSWGGRFSRKGERDGEMLRMDLRVSAAENTSDVLSAYAYALSASGLTRTENRQTTTSANQLRDFTGDYESPVAAGVLKLGYKIMGTKNQFDTAWFMIDPASRLERVSAGRTNRFHLDQRNLATYGSWQARLTQRWGVLAGMRIEHHSMELRQLTTNVSSKNTSTQAIPSLYATYKVSDSANLRLSYAHRIRRPSANDLNPFVVYRDEQNSSSGNPNLKPTQIDSFEVGYETKFGTLETTLRAYLRNENDAIANRSIFISETVLLTTRDNVPGNRSRGLEFVVSGKITPNLSINANGNLAHAEQPSFSGTSLFSRRSTNTLSLRGRVNYQLTPADQFQFSVQMQGKSIYAQGYREPVSFASINYRRTLMPGLSLVVNVADVFRSNAIETVVDTATLHETSLRRFDGRTAFIGLSYRFGRAPGATGK